MSSNKKFVDENEIENIISDTGKINLDDSLQTKNIIKFVDDKDNIKENNIINSNSNIELSINKNEINTNNYTNKESNIITKQREVNKELGKNIIKHHEKNYNEIEKKL